MTKRSRLLAALLVGAVLLGAAPGAFAMDKAKLEKAAVAAVALKAIKLPQGGAAPKPPKFDPAKPEIPKVDIPGVPKEEPPKDKKEAKKQIKAQAQAEAQSVDIAFAKVKAMAQAGDMRAEFIMGHACYTGQMEPESDEAALVWWQRASKQGHADADAYIGLFYAEGRGGALLSPEEAIRRWRRAAGNGSALGAALLGFTEYDVGGIKERLTALHWLREAADKGNAPAKAALLEILKKGVEANQGFSRKTEWKAEAKKATLVLLYTQAGLDAFKGRFAPKSDESAVVWWEIAEPCGDLEARALLGTAYYTGRGIGQDYQKAAQYLKSAAAAGQPLAEYTLGKAYLAGNGVKKNTQMAKNLMRASGGRGITDAKQTADRMEGRK